MNLGLQCLQAWVVPATSLDTFATALDWDGRVRPFFNQLLQSKTLVIQVQSSLFPKQHHHLRIVDINSQYGSVTHQVPAQHACHASSAFGLLLFGLGSMQLGSEAITLL